MFWVELQGYGRDGKPAASKIGDPFQTIQAAKAADEARRGPLARSVQCRSLDG